jgi:hypothetical protein
MTDENKPKDPDEIQIVFAEGCFDHFDGTQEELDNLLAEITRMVKSGEVFEKSRPVNIDEMDPEEAIMLARALGIDLESIEDFDDVEELPTNKRLLN